MVLSSPSMLVISRLMFGSVCSSYRDDGWMGVSFGNNGLQLTESCLSLLECLSLISRVEILAVMLRSSGSLRFTSATAFSSVIKRSRLRERASTFCVREVLFRAVQVCNPHMP